MNKKEQETHNLLELLKETHERFYTMMLFCERLQPVKLDSEEDPHYVNHNWDNDIVPTYPITVDLTDEEEMMKTKLFRVEDEMVDEDQTTRSILKDVRGYIRHYHDVLDLELPEVYK